MALTRTAYGPQIELAAARYSLPPRLVEAVVLQESAGHTDAFRFEPAFWRRYLAGKPQYQDAIPRRVSSSYGLMQVMYTTAVERGFTGFPEELFIPENGLEWGCCHLRHLMDWTSKFPVSVERQKLSALAAYNGGMGGNAPRYAEGERTL